MNKYRILIVDDEPQVLEALKKTLIRNQKIECEVVTSTCSIKAKELLNLYTFDLIISDYKMPQESGLDLLSYVNLNKPQIKRILITGYTTPGLAEDMLSKNIINSYLEKPWDNTEFIATILSILQD